MGVLAGVDMLLLLSPVIVSGSNKPTATIVRLILQISAAILSLPAIVFGGSWMSNAFLGLDKVAYFSECYSLSLTIMFLLIVVFPLARWILKIGRTIGEP
jgi:hypothetical protein